MDKKTHAVLSIWKWVLMNSIGWLLGVVFILGFAAISETLFGEATEESGGGQAILGIGMGAGIGLMQSIALRKSISDVWKWGLSCMAGFSLAFLAYDAVAILLKDASFAQNLKVEYTLPLATFLAGFLASLFQYVFVLRKREKAFLPWLMVQPLCWIVAELLTLGGFLDFKMYLPRVLVLIIVFLSLLIGGPVQGFLSGKWLLPRLKESGGIKD